MQENSARGLKSKLNGRFFESLFQLTCEQQQISVTPFPEGCRRLGLKKLIQIKTPWDFILSYAGKTAFIDVKCTIGKAFANSKILEHQVFEMTKHKYSSHCGYVINTKENNKVFYSPVSVLESNLNKRGSISFETPGSILLGTFDNFDILNLMRN